MAQLKSTNVIGNLSVTGLSKATDFKGVTAELSGAVSIGGETNISGETHIDNILSAKKLLIKNDNDVTIGHTYTGTNYLELVLGNSTATSATNGTQGYLYLYGTGTNWTKFISGNPTANNTLTLPTASGTIALTSNIPGAEKGIALTDGKYGHSNKAITAGSVGSAQSPSHGGTFAIPKITYDAYGHITGATTVNITLPGDNNTDTKVTQTVTAENKSYPLLLAPNGQKETTTTTSYFDSGITLNPSTNIISGAKLEYIYNTAPTQPDAVIKIGSHNFDVNIFKVYDRDSGFNANGGYGYSLMYNGTGTGVNNALTLYCDNAANDPCIGWQLNQSGNIGLGQVPTTTHRLAVKGHSVFDGYLTMRTGHYYGEVNFAPTMSTNTMGHILYYTGASTGDTVFDRGHFTFREYSYTDGTTTKGSYYEQYVLPDVNTGRKGNATYNILTTKNAVTVAQGGTGATSLTAQRMAYTKTNGDGDTVLTAGYHYVDNTYVAVGSTSQPNYTLYVGTENGAAGTMGVAKSITITNTGAIGHLNFSRPNYNYITAPATGSIAFDVTGTGGGSGGPCDLVIAEGELIPGSTKETNLGSSSKQWNNIYANNIILSSTAEGSQTAAPDSTNPPALRIGTSNSAIHLIIDRDTINAKATSTKAGTLNLNESGGLVQIGSGGMKTSGQIVMEKDTNSFTVATTGSLVTNTTTTGNWSRSWAWKHNDTTKVSMGAYGKADVFQYWYVGSDYDSTWIQINSSAITAKVPIVSGSTAGSWVDACNGKALINSTKSPASNVFSPMMSAATTNGRMTVAFYKNALQAGYITKANCDSNTNTTAATATLFNEEGGASWPGVVTVTNTTEAETMTSGALKVSGGIGAAGQVSAKSIQIDNSVKFVYNSNDKCIDVIFN